MVLVWRIHWVKGVDSVIYSVVHVFVIVAVDPVVQGKTRAEQFYKGDEEGMFSVSKLCGH